MKLQELREEFQFYGFHTIEELKYMETSEGKAEAKLKKEEENAREAAESKITRGGKKGLHPNQVMKFLCQGQL